MITFFYTWSSTINMFCTFTNEYRISCIWIRIRIFQKRSSKIRT